MGIISLICAIISILLCISSLVGVTKIENNIKKRIKMNQEKLQKAKDLDERMKFLINKLQHIDNILAQDDFRLQLVSCFGATLLEKEYLPINTLEFMSQYKDNIVSEIKRLEEEFDSI